MSAKKPMRSAKKSKVDAKRAPSRTKRHARIRPHASSVARSKQLTSFRVKSTSANGVYRHITVVSDGGKETPIKVHRMALIGPDDRVHFDPLKSSRLSVCSTEDVGDLISVTPHFERRERMRLGAIDYEIVIKELTTQSDLDEYDYLEGFHYKTSSAIVTEENDPEKGRTAVGGRKGVLIAYLRIGKRLVPAGYIELHMPLLMCKPRHVLFAHGFHHPKRPVAWDEWDVPSMRKYVNLIVRIARVVMAVLSLCKRLRGYHEEAYEWRASERLSDKYVGEFIIETVRQGMGLREVIKAFVHLLEIAEQYRDTNLEDAIRVTPRVPAS